MEGPIAVCRLGAWTQALWQGGRHTHRSCWVGFPGPQRCSEPQQAELFATASDNVLRVSTGSSSTNRLGLDASTACHRSISSRLCSHPAPSKTQGSRTSTKDLPSWAWLHAACLNGLLTKQVPRTQLRHVALPSGKPPLVLPEGSSSTAAGMQRNQHLSLFLGRSSACSSGADEELLLPHLNHPAARWAEGKAQR